MQNEPVWLVTKWSLADRQTGDAPSGQRRDGFSTHRIVFWGVGERPWEAAEMKYASWQMSLLYVLAGRSFTRQGQNNRRLVCLSEFSPLNWSFAYWNERLWNSDTLPAHPPPLPPLSPFRSSRSVCVQPTHSLPIIASSSSLGSGPSAFQQWSLKPITHLLREDGPRHQGEIPLCLGVAASCLRRNVTRVFFCSADH